LSCVAPLLVVLAWLSAPALAAAAGPASAEYLLTTWDVEKGLPQNSATAIAQTPDGHLWFGTWSGLCRFDGTLFTTFTRFEAPHLPANQVVNLHLDRQGGLWISTARGLPCVRDDVWTDVSADEPWRDEPVRFFAEGPAGQFYVVTWEGRLLRRDGERFKELPTPPGDPDAGRFPHVNADGSFWVVTPGFVGRPEGAGWRETIPATTWAKERWVGAVTGRGSRLWIITRERVRRYRGTELEWEGPGPQAAPSLWQGREDSRGALWLGTMADGVYRLTPDGAWLHLTQDDGLSSNVVRCVFEDREGTIWLGTEGGGLVSLRPRLFTVWGRDQGMPEPAVTYAAVDPRGRVHVAMSREGVAYLEGNAVHRFCPPRSTRPFTAEVTTSVHVDRQGRQWVGTGDGKNILHLFDGPTHRTFDRNAVGAEAVNAFLEDSRGRLWIGTNRGLARFDGEGLQSYPLPDISDEGVLGMAEDPRDGTLWVSGSVSGGLYGLRGDRFALAPEVQGMNQDRIVSLLADADGTLWLGAERACSVGCLRAGRLSVLGEAHGLPAAHSLNPLMKDQAGNLWLGCDQGILRLPRGELEAVLAGRQRDMAAQLFTKEDGLPTTDCSGNALKGVDAQGRLWFPTVKGLVMVEPWRFRPNRATPPVVITKVLRDDAVASTRGTFLTSGSEETAAVVVPPGTDRLEIHYAGLCLWGPGRVRYRYKIEGLDKDWVDVGNHKVAYLQAPRPGTYTFHVKAANNHGVWAESGATLVLEVKPFYWQTTWFQVASVAGLMAGAGLVARGVTRGRLRRQIERLRQQQALAREQARLASVLEATSDLVAFLDESGKVLYLNPAGRRLAGLDAAAGFAGLSLADLHPPWAARLLLEEGFPAAARDGTWGGETALRHGDGRELPLSQVVVAHKAPDGAVGFLSTIARDMTERKLAEEQLRASLREKEALLREVHHRVKNNLQVINSLLALQAYQAPDPAVGELLAESQGRVRTMALVHENLYRAGNFASVPLAAHVEGLCAHLFASYGRAAGRVDLHLRVPDVALDLERAVPCGLIVNELVSNALKHAFPGSRTGVLRVEFDVLTGGLYRLVVADDGVGLPPGLDPHHAASMGLQLVADLTEQLGGTLDVAGGPGTTFTVRFPAEGRGGAQP
jgi:PAS domain S-box-containing protein